MDGLRAAVDAYLSDHAGEADVGRLRCLLEADDPWSRRSLLHATASALVVDAPNRRVLLRWHARLQRWLQVGGHADPGESDPWEITLREAREETGLADLGALNPLIGRRPVQIVIVPVPATADEPAHEHADIRYALVTKHPELAAPESPEASVRWLAIDQAKAETVEPSFREYLERVELLLSRPDGNLNSNLLGTSLPDERSTPRQ